MLTTAVLTCRPAPPTFSYGDWPRFGAGNPAPGRGRQAHEWCDLSHWSHSSNPVHPVPARATLIAERIVAAPRNRGVIPRTFGGPRAEGFAVGVTAEVVTDVHAISQHCDRPPFMTDLR
jgi:hypothetical protein